MNVDAEDNIVEFEEKPKQPKSNLASMGIYCFSWQELRKYLVDDEADPSSQNDFGKNIIPKDVYKRQALRRSLSTRAISAMGYTLPVSLLTDITDTSTVSSRRAWATCSAVMRPARSGFRNVTS